MECLSSILRLEVVGIGAWRMFSTIIPLDNGVVAREDLVGALEGAKLPGDACLVLTTDPKPRLRWTTELHERFVDAVTQLGGPDSMFTFSLSLSPIFLNFGLFFF